MAIFGVTILPLSRLEIGVRGFLIPIPWRPQLAYNGEVLLGV